MKVWVEYLKPHFLGRVEEAAGLGLLSLGIWATGSDKMYSARSDLAFDTASLWRIVEPLPPLEATLDDSALWDLKQDQGFSEMEASAFVEIRRQARGLPVTVPEARAFADTLGDAKEHWPERKKKLSRDVLIGQVLSALGIISAALLAAGSFAVLWSWFGARKRTPVHGPPR
jgi:hypothetical protein